jgi:hypothetical protein
MISPDAARVLVASGVTEYELHEGRWSVVISASGSARVIERHRREIRAIASKANVHELIVLSGTENSRKGAAGLLEGLREFPALVMAADRAAVIFRIASMPAQMDFIAHYLRNLAAKHSIRAAMIMRPHGLIYFAIMPSQGEIVDAGSLILLAKGVFQETYEFAANARIEFAPAALKSAINVWGAARPDSELMRRVKKVFDPGNVLSPGRFAGGI